MAVASFAALCLFGVLSGCFVVDGSPMILRHLESTQLVDPIIRRVPMTLGTSHDHERLIMEACRCEGPSFDNSVQGKRRRQSEIRYLLRAKKVEMHSHEMNKSGHDNTNGKWCPTAKLKVIIHGFTPPSKKNTLRRLHTYKIADAYVLKGDFNVVLVNWSSLSTEPLYRYYEAAASVRYAGEDVANFLLNLKEKKLIQNWDDVHIIGFSLGAHVAGLAGHLIHNRTGELVARITGLDPAGPLFEERGQLPRNTSGVLDISDAKFVDVIHCNMGSIVTSFGANFGTPVQTGHADFYPDGGETQSVCTEKQNRREGCSHRICDFYYAKSINKYLVSCPCTSWEEFKKGKCPCERNDGKAVSMGDQCPTTASGRYYRYIEPELTKD